MWLCNFVWLVIDCLFPCSPHPCIWCTKPVRHGDLVLHHRILTWFVHIMQAYAVWAATQMHGPCVLIASAMSHKTDKPLLYSTGLHDLALQVQAHHNKQSSHCRA